MVFTKYRVGPPHMEGVAIAGAFLELGDLGFIYAPLEFDEAQKFYPIKHEEFVAEVNKWAKRVAEGTP